MEVGAISAIVNPWVEKESEAVASILLIFMGVVQRTRRLYASLDNTRGHAAIWRARFVQYTATCYSTLSPFSRIAYESILYKFLSTGK